MPTQCLRYLRDHGGGGFAGARSGTCAALCGTVRGFERSIAKARMLIPGLAEVVPIHPRHLRVASERDWHQRRHIAPQEEAPEVPTRFPDPFLGPSHILDDQRNMTTGGLARLALNAKAGVEQRVVRRWKCLGAAPWHRAVAVALARR